ncbi:hypothetical protein HPB47_024076 [Ixodes persulcatus]|uniref:Uncharacterized protein n=1 Tax=Ixodes persulcatus TaxID=34615 RepID=A0AC60Q5A8_IXOPE|nr:hypothetical protein HPB47_024076 [Ixodes persulcatus]
MPENRANEEPDGKVVEGQDQILNHRDLSLASQGSSLNSIPSCRYRWKKPIQVKPNLSSSRHHQGKHAHHQPLPWSRRVLLF